MYAKIALTAAALLIGIGYQPAPADAKSGIVLVHGKGHGHHQGRRDHHRYGHGWKHYGRHNRSRYSAPYWYGSYCHWKQRPFKVRVWDGYYGWRHKTIWRPVRVCY